MMKSSTKIKKVHMELTEFASEGILMLDGTGMLVISTEDFGEIDLVSMANELGLLNQQVKVKFILKLEDAEDVSPLDIE